MCVCVSVCVCVCVYVCVCVFVWGRCTFGSPVVYCTQCSHSEDGLIHNRSCKRPRTPNTQGDWYRGDAASLARFSASELLYVLCALVRLKEEEVRARGGAGGGAGRGRRARLPTCTP